MILKRKNDLKSHSQTFNHIILFEKGPIFYRISDESALIRNFLRNGRVRVKLKKLTSCTAETPLVVLLLLDLVV